MVRAGRLAFKAGVVAGLLVVSASGIAFGQDDDMPSHSNYLSQIGSGGTYTYNEIIAGGRDLGAPVVPPGPPGAIVPPGEGGAAAEAAFVVAPAPVIAAGTAIPCIAQASAPGCADTYVGFYAFDLNSDDTAVVGFIDYATNANSHLLYQATVWKPGQGGLVLLTDNGAATRVIGYYGNAGSSASESASFAFDITGDSSAIVGTSWGAYSNGGVRNTDYFLPLLWERDVNGNYVESGALPIAPVGAVPGTDYYYAGATSISEDGKHVAGFVGDIDETIPGNHGSDLTPQNPEAGYWLKTGSVWQLRELGTLPRGSGVDAASVANDVNDLGQVVGWSGTMPSLVGQQRPNGQNPNLGTGLADSLVYTLLGSPRSAPPPNWQPHPFVWTQSHGLVALDDHGGNLTTGEARAVSQDGSVAVGWGKNIVMGHYWATAWVDHPALHGPWAGDDEALVLGYPSTANGETPTDSIANAVDASGHFIVGDILVPDASRASGFHSFAGFWQLSDDQTTVVATATLEDALGAAGVPLAGADLTLTRATGVRVVLDANGNPQSVFFSGEGEGSFGSWLATLAAPAAPGAPPVPGLTTPASITTSLGIIEGGIRDLNDGFLGAATQQYCTRPKGTSVEDEPWCYFAVGRGSLYLDNGANGVQLNSRLGVAHFFNADTQVGGSLGIDHFSGGQPSQSSYTAWGVGAGIYAAHEPDEGVEGKVSLSVGQIIQATFTRLYVNGASTAASTGSTSGFGASLFGELGYSFRLDEQTRVTPYVSGEISRVALNGFTDAGGPFNAVINPITGTTTRISIGVTGEHEISDDLTVYGALEVSAVRQQTSGVTATVAGTPFTVAGPQGWYGEAGVTAGIRKEFDAHSNGFAQVTLNSDFSGRFGATILGGYNHTF